MCVCFSQVQRLSGTCERKTGHGSANRITRSFQRIADGSRKSRRSHGSESTRSNDIAGRIKRNCLRLKRASAELLREHSPRRTIPEIWKLLPICLGQSTLGSLERFTTLFTPCLHREVATGSVACHRNREPVAPSSRFSPASNLWS